MFKSLNLRALGISAQQSETIEWALSFGFRAIDLNVVEFHENVQTDGMPKTRRLIDSAKIRVGMFALPFRLSADIPTYQQMLQMMPIYAKYAQDLGAFCAYTVLDAASDDLPYHQNFELHRTRLSEVAKALDSTGMRLAVGFQGSPSASQGKNFRFIQDIDQVCVLLSAVPSKCLGILYDTWEVHVSGGSIEKLQKLNPNQLCMLALSDAPADMDPATLPVEQRYLPGKGSMIDCAAHLLVAAEKNFAGPVVAAGHPSRQPGLRRDAQVQLAGKQLDEIWKTAGLGPTGKLLTTA